MEAANAFIRDVYLPAHNARFAVPPAGQGSGFTLVPGVDLDEILCVQEERQVGNDNCVSYRTLNTADPRKPDAPALRQGRGSTFMSTPTAATPSFTGRDASAAMTRKDDSRRPDVQLNPLGPRRLWTCGRRFALPTSPRGRTEPEEADN